jgi:hypothetical protein
MFSFFEKKQREKMDFQGKSNSKIVPFFFSFLLIRAAGGKGTRSAEDICNTVKHEGRGRNGLYCSWGRSLGFYRVEACIGKG